MPHNQMQQHFPQHGGGNQNDGNQFLYYRDGWLDDTTIANEETNFFTIGRHDGDVGEFYTTIIPASEVSKSLNDW